MRLVHLERDGDRHPERLINADRITEVLQGLNGKVCLTFGDESRYVTLEARQAEALWAFLRAESTPARGVLAHDPDGSQHAICTGGPDDGKLFPCRSCNGPEVYFRTWESSDGGYKHVQYHCRTCGWVEGADA